MEFGSSGETFAVSQLLHPSTYLNKILLGSNQGTMQLWNIRSNRMIYEFQSLGSPITCLVQSPVVDVVAVGLLDGTVVLYNIRTDQRLMQFHQEGRVTAISFRTDDNSAADNNNEAHQIMVTANMAGDVAMWSLNTRRLVHLLKNAHDGCISAMQFLPGNPVLITASTDNSIKQWIFDDGTGSDGHSTPRLLRQRSGHQSPPALVRFYDGMGHQLLSGGGQDRCLRFFSTIRDEQNVEMSQGSLGKLAKKRQQSRVDQLRLPQIIQLAASQSKQQRDWDNVLTCHLNDSVARTWSVERKSIGKYEFKSLDKSNVKVWMIIN
jgi:U3 small nucleolar RNA-associated protein 21